MPGERFLIVNADDFGKSPGVNWGVIKAYEYGIVTSASLMIRWDGAKGAATYARKRRNSFLGLHIDRGEWVYEKGKWSTNYEVVRFHNAQAVAQEVANQMERFIQLVGRPPTHLDSHQHVHRQEPLRSILIHMARKIRIPVRHFNPNIHYCGKFYGQTKFGLPNPRAISLSNLVNIFKTMPPGYTELGCHPGAVNDLQSVYRSEREQELKVLTDPQARKALTEMKIQLRSFGDLSL